MPAPGRPRLDARGHVTTLRTHAGHEDRQLAGDQAHRTERLRLGGADDEPALTVRRPAGGHHLGHPLVQGAAAHIELLHLGAAGVARAADREHGAGGEQRERGVGAEVRVVRHRVGAVAPERLAGVELGGRADVTALGVEDQRHVRVTLADVGAHPFQRPLGALGGEVGDLGFERAHEVGGGVDDGDAEPLDRRRRVDRHQRVERLGQLRRVGVEADAQHRSRRRPRRGELGVEAAHRRLRSWPRGTRPPRRWRRRRSSGPNGCARRRARPAGGRSSTWRSP